MRNVSVVNPNKDEGGSGKGVSFLHTSSSLVEIIPPNSKVCHGMQLHKMDAMLQFVDTM